MKKGEAGRTFYSRAHFYTLREVKELLKECSFRVVAVKSTLSYSPCENPPG